MIKFRDFVPPQEQLGLLGKPSLTTVEAAVDAANNWIDSFSIEIFNVETLLLPNVRKDEETIEAELSSDGETFWYQVVRVWYREEDGDLHTDEEIRVFDDD